MEDIMNEDLGSEYDGELDSDDYLNSDEEYVELGDNDGNDGFVSALLTHAASRSPR
jgi:hypothetical protein